MRVYFCYAYRNDFLIWMRHTACQPLPFIWANHLKFVNSTVSQMFPLTKKRSFLISIQLNWFSFQIDFNKFPVAAVALSIELLKIIGVLFTNWTFWFFDEWILSVVRFGEGWCFCANKLAQKTPFFFYLICNYICCFRSNTKRNGIKHQRRWAHQNTNLICFLPFILSNFSRRFETECPCTSLLWIFQQRSPYCMTAIADKGQMINRIFKRN